MAKWWNFGSSGRDSYERWELEQPYKEAFGEALLNVVSEELQPTAAAATRDAPSEAVAETHLEAPAVSAPAPIPEMRFTDHLRALKQRKNDAPNAIAQAARHEAAAPAAEEKTESPHSFVQALKRFTGPDRETLKKEIPSMQENLLAARAQAEAGMFDTSAEVPSTVIQQHAPAVAEEVHVRSTAKIEKYRHMNDAEKEAFKRQVKSKSGNGLLQDPEQGLAHVWEEMKQKPRPIFGERDDRSIADKVVEAAGHLLNKQITPEEYSNTVQDRVREIMYLKSVNHDAFSDRFKRELFTEALEQLPYQLNGESKIAQAHAEKMWEAQGQQIKR